MLENIHHIFHSKEYLLEDVGYFQRLHQLILNNSHDIISIHKFPDMSFEYINPATVIALGYKKEELYGKNIFAIIHPDDFEEAKNKFKEMLFTNNTLECRYLNKDGSYHWMDVNGAALTYDDKDDLFLIVARDISDKKNIEENLFISEHRYQTVVEDQIELICRYNPDSKIIFVNRAFCAAFTKTSEEMIGKYLFDFAPELTQEAMHRFLSGFSKTEPVKKYVYPITYNKGKVSWFEWITRAIFNMKEEITEFQVVARDITDHHIEKEALNSMRNELEKEVQERTNELLKVSKILENKIAELNETERALGESINYYKTVFENTGALTIIVEADMTISMANGRCAELLGVTREELIGREWTEFVPEHLHETLRERHSLRRRDPKSVPNQYSIQIVDKQMQRRDGVLEVAMIPSTAKSVATFIDLTNFNKIGRAFNSISAVNTAMIHARRENKLLETVCQNIISMGGYNYAWIGYLSSNLENRLETIAKAGKNKGYVEEINSALELPSQNKGLINEAIKTGKPIITKIESIHLNNDNHFETIKVREYYSNIVVPLLNGNEVFGILNVVSDKTTEAVFDDEPLFTDMANHLAYAIASLRARENLKRANSELGQNLKRMHQLLLQSASSLGNVVSIRDPYTAGHQKKVANLAVAIASEIGMPKNRIEGLKVAGNLHDIGKLNIPAEILNKPGGLNDIEKELIKTHPKIGYDILKDIEFPWPIAEMILQHHERLDGSGYPNGLTNDEIMIEAKILAVADVVDSMATHRPFRPALGIKKALAEIEENKNILFEPTVVDACIKVFKEKGFKLSL